MTTQINVLAHHKCGTRWLRSVLIRVADDNNLSFLESNVGVFDRPNVSIFFASNSFYPNLANSIDLPTIHVIRNPLNLICSAYHSHLKTHSLDGWEILEAQRNTLNNCGKNEGLYLTLSFLQQLEFFPRTPGPLCSLSAWDFDDSKILTLRSEDLFEDMNGCLGKALKSVGIDNLALPQNSEFSFEKFSLGRKQGVVDEASHYRSGGQVDTWRDELPEPIIDYVRTHYRDLLERFYPETLT